jgi:hypothetical protein
MTKPKIVKIEETKKVDTIENSDLHGYGITFTMDYKQ